MNLATTSGLFVFCLSLTVLFGWLGARPAKPGRVRLAPWRFLMVLTFTAAIAFAVHLVSLMRAGGGG